MNYLKSLFILFLFMATGIAPGDVWAREPGKINHPSGSPPTAALFQPGGAYAGYVPKFVPDFWKQTLNYRLPVGSTLTGVLQERLSSRKSKPGDVFEILLADGVGVGNRMLVPPQSRIVGAVVSVTPASAYSHGKPGRLQVALRSLVLPDGQQVPIYGFIDENLNLVPREAKSRNAGQSIADYGQSVKSFFGSFGTGIGAVMNRRHRGMDFELEKDQIVTVRTNRSLDVPELVEEPAVASGQAAQNQVPGPVNEIAPGLAGPPGQADMPFSAPMAQSETLPVQSVPATGDPNAVFSQPVNPLPLSDIPDPF